VVQQVERKAEFDWVLGATMTSRRFEASLVPSCHILALNVSDYTIGALAINKYFLVTCRQSVFRQNLVIWSNNSGSLSCLIRNFVPFDERTEELVQNTFSDSSDESDGCGTQEERIKQILDIVNSSGLRYEEFVRAHPKFKNELDALMRRGCIGTNPIDGGLCSLMGVLS
jgi:hypothetical protein